jgi:hypothetical protein
MNTKTQKENLLHIAAHSLKSLLFLYSTFSSQQERRHRNKENEKSKQNYNNNSP